MNGGDHRSYAATGRKSVKQRVLDAISGTEEEWTAAKVSNLRDLPFRNVGQALSALFREGHIQRVRPGVYRAGVRRV